MISKALKEVLNQKYPAGTRIELENMIGEGDMSAGLKGTVNFIDDLGQIHINWDNGRTLALDPIIDSFSKINEQDESMDFNQNMGM